MAKNINSAFRIKEILNSVKSKPDKTLVHEVWSEIFSIEEKDRNKVNFIISRCLADVHDEVEFVRAEMKKLEYSENIYSPSLNKCNNTFNVQLVGGQCSQLKQNITSEVLVALGFCSEILPNEEMLLDEKSFEELKEMASTLRSKLESSTLPTYTKNIIEKHINKIEEAIPKYKAIGVKALDEVVQSAYGEVIANEAIFEQAKDSEELGQLSRIWRKSKSILDGAVIANKYAGAAQGLSESGQKVLEFLEGFGA